MGPDGTIAALRLSDPVRLTSDEMKDLYLMSVDRETFQTNLYISALAEVTVSERGQAKHEWGGYDTTELVKTEKDAELSIGIDEDSPDNLIRIGFSGHHIENKESGRAFHSTISAHFSLSQIISLNRFLTYLIEIESRPVDL